VVKPAAETSKAADEAAAPAPAPAIDAGAAKDIASMLADINFDD
jgi:predicted cobalt transporter CbtA